MAIDVLSFMGDEEGTQMRRIITTLFLAASLMPPLALRADDHDKHHKEKRYYDKDARDWHEWNEREERAYRRYLEERRRERRDWVKLNREEQRDYWKWRHSHPDAMLFPEAR